MRWSARTVFTTVGAVTFLCLLSETRAAGPDITTAEKRSGTVWPTTLIGYTEYRTDLPGGRHANVVTMRACVIRSDGRRRRVLASRLTEKPHTWTQFAGWSTDGRIAIVGNGWESPENAAWEEEHRQFRFNAEGWLYDSA